MDITKLLKKTKDKASKIQPLSKRELNIATGYRPYDDNIGDKQSQSFVESIPIKESKEESEKESFSSQKEVLKEASKQSKIKLKESIRDQKEVVKEPSVKLKEVQKKSISSPIRNQFTIGPENNELIIDKIQKLIGHQKKIFFFIIHRCCNRGALDTGPITTDDFIKLCNTSMKTIKTQIKRLEKKEIIYRGNGKKARGGYSIFLISEEIKNIALSIQRQFDIKAVFKESIKEPNDSVVSSSNIINTTTNTNLPGEWQSLDLEPLKDSGLSESHIIQLHREYLKKPTIALPVGIIQESINHLSFDLRHNDAKKKIKSEPVPFLINLLKQGRPYSSTTPDKVLSPSEEAMEKYLMAQKIKAERKAKMEEELFELECSNWLNNLDELEKEKIIKATEPNPLKLPPKMQANNNRLILRDHFSQNIWGSVKKKVLESLQLI